MIFATFRIKTAVLAALVLFGPTIASAAKITVAAAADLSGAMTELSTAFEKQTGNTVAVVLGSSGNFYAQISNGAPFDVFMSADTQYPEKLAQAGKGDEATLYRYARGAIVIWVRNSFPLNPRDLHEATLTDPLVKRIAIANPAHAPYGRAAMAALKTLGLDEKLSDKFVFGENVSQAAQFVQSGNAQAGLIALSLALSPGMRDGKYWEFDPESYPPLDQAAIVIAASKDKAAAVQWIEFLRSPTAQAILLKYGFRSPSQATGGQK